MRKYPPPQLCLLFLLFFVCSNTFAQTRILTGVVKDSTNQPLVAATVTIQGTKISTTTAADGSFTISNAPAGSINLVVSYVGYTTQTLPIGSNQTSVDVTLQSSANTISDVVVTALGIKKDERKLGYSVSTVNGNQLTKARETNVALSLSGQVAGLNVHGTSGGPGGTARILLRGMPSMNSGGSPLFVINGVPMDNSNRGSAGEWGGADEGDGIGNINPDDIETMTVLKGQAASALYGARASNGVILITTKSGKKGAATIEYNTNYVVDKAIDYSDYQYVYGQGQNGEKPANATAALVTGRLSWGSKLGGGETVIGYDGKTYPYTPYKDNFDNFYRTGNTFTNTIAVSGGGDNGSYRLSASNLSNDAIIQNSGIKRKTFNLNINQNITSKLSVTAIANYIDEQSQNREYLSDGPGNPNNFLFLANNINEDIFKPGYDSTGEEIVFSDDNYVTNPWFVINRWINNSGRKRIIGTLSARYNFTDWIYGLVRLGYDHENDDYLTVTPTGTSYSYNSQGQSGQFNNQSNAQTSELNVDGIVGVNHSITSDLNFNDTLGANLRKNRFESIGVSGSQFVIPYLYTPNNVVSFGRSYAFNSKEVHSAYYSVDLNYKTFLTLTTTGRYDAFSTLFNSSIPKDQRNKFTPSVTGSFIFSEFLHSSTLNFGKLRASYAQTSGEPSRAYQTAVYYSVGNSINGVPTGNFSSTLPNLFLKPFTKTEVEIGTDLKFFNSRLNFDIAVYRQKTKNEIMNGALSASTGYTSRVVANGSVQNRGVEIGITGSPVRNRNFSWDITLNYTHVQNKILKTDEAANNVGLGTYRPLNANTAYVVGLPGPQILAHDYVYDSISGDIVVDASGLPVQGKLIPMGSVLPTDYGGLTNSFSYKNFNLSFLVDYNYGNKILSATSYYSIYRGLNTLTLDGRETGITTGVTSDGKPNTVSASAQSYYQRLASISRINVLDGDYIKLRQITLGYTIPESAFKNVPLFSSIQVSLVARNLATLMKNSDNIDPEAGFNASLNYAGIEGTSIPSTRTFGFNVNFKFKN
jgi:TonB-linked SusC/RagA family outer membrane protein